MRRALLLLIGLLTLSFVAAPSMAFAAFDIFPPESIDCAGTAQESAVCNSQVQPGQDPIAGSGGVLAKITDIVALVAGMAAVIVLIIGGIRYITSDGDSGKVQSAKSTIIYALIGVAVIVVARSLVVYVVLRLV